ncbi:glyoxylate/hydroxypyruvate reductase A [Palleronia sp. LCG004]|uniref:2-hydroxyacid dehydrogenase n=1 Tax=Palleronia sp. LCG004 TaxID=3079304 RepID=UPI0029426C26|nr:glyoxylate/hydroxypyruvate reductase A [Palleronia sp. LCG004]WOI56251.1 glyoxylate/hydroxypyruvate reductase A [Palleronia sp. LCG004]
MTDRTLRILFAARDDKWDEYRPYLTRALSETGLEADLSRDHPAEEVDYIVHAPNGGLSDFSGFPRLRAVLSLWAGVEDIVGNDTLEVPLTRMVDPGLTEGMVEYVTGHVLRHHLGMDAQIHGLDGEWTGAAPPLARDRKVTILGLGALGAACADALSRLNFDVAGWSRSPKDLDGIATHHGEDGLAAALGHGEITVLLLPLTRATEGIVDAGRLALMPKGAVLLNPGRGGLVDEAALLDALGTGQIAHATLDTFRTEPLPKDHPFWTHPRVTVTPHIASATRAPSASRAIVDNIARAERGQALENVVDRSAGY